MPKPISKKKCKSLKRVWVKRSQRAKAYCRKKPSRPRAPRAPRVAARADRAADVPEMYQYGFTCELRFVQNDDILDCEQVDGAIKAFMDNYFRDNLPIIAEQFNVLLYTLYRQVRRDFPEPNLTLHTLRRENCSIRFVFHSNEKISRLAHRLAMEAMDIDIILPPGDIQALFDRFHYDMDQFGFLSHLPDYTNEANLSDPHYRYMFKSQVLIDEHTCHDAEIMELKQNLRNYTIDNRDRLIERLNQGLRRSGKNMNVVTLRFEPDTCHFKFDIQNQGPLSALDYQFISRGHEWEILLEDEFNEPGEEFTLRLNAPFGAEYTYTH